MFPALLANTRQRINTVRKTVETNDRIRDLLAGVVDGNLLRNLMTSSPSTSEGKIYDHCAALTRLYAIYESFVHGLITDLLGILPTLYRYTDLNEGFRNEHRNGVAYILQRMEYRRHQHLSTESVVSGYHDALSGIERYIILPEALLRHEDNLRMNVLDSLFSRLDMSNVPSWISAHRMIRNFIVEIRGEQTSVESELTNFVQDRNDAAHGQIDNVLGKESLLDYCDFIDALCQAVYERVNHRILSRQLEVGTSHKMGIVTEEYSNRIVVAKLSDTTVTLGGSVFFMSDRYCYSAIIESIRVDDVDRQTVTVTHEREIGFQTSVQAKEKAVIIFLPNKAK